MFYLITKEASSQEYLFLGDIPLKEAIRKAQKVLPLHEQVFLEDSNRYLLEIHAPVREASENRLKPSCITKATWNSAGAKGLQIVWEDDLGRTTREDLGTRLVAFDESSYHFKSERSKDLTMDQDIAEDYIRYILDHPYPDPSYEDR